METANETLPKSIEAKEFSALFCRDRHASGTHIVFEWMFGKNEVQDQTNGADTTPNQSASAEEPSSILYVNHQLGFLWRCR